MRLNLPLASVLRGTKEHSLRVVIDDTGRGREEEDPGIEGVWGIALLLFVLFFCCLLASASLILLLVSFFFLLPRGRVGKMQSFSTNSSCKVYKSPLNSLSPSTSPSPSSSSDPLRSRSRSPFLSFSVTFCFFFSKSLLPPPPPLSIGPTDTAKFGTTVVLNLTGLSPALENCSEHSGHFWCVCWVAPRYLRMQV